MVQAIWNDVILAESKETIEVEGQFYFPPESVNKEHLVESTTTSICPWKGTAQHYSVNINGKTHKDAAWSYPEPSKQAEAITNYIAFGKDIKLDK